MILSEDLNEEWLRVLSKFPSEAIESAFRAWRDVSPFFPAISEIRELCQGWVRIDAEVREEKERKVRQAEIEQARERGQLIEWPDVIKKFNDVVSRDAAAKLVNKAVMPGVPTREIVITQERREIIRQQIEALKARHSK